jgi:small subunit ribosomal protein S5
MENKETTNKTASTATAPVAPMTAPASPVTGTGFAGRPDNRDRRPGGRRPSMREGRERVKPEFDTKIINIRRVTRVASGGRRFSFSVAVVSGDKKGRVGVGLGKAGDTSLAIDKATRDAKKHMVKLNLLPNMSIAHAVDAKYASCVVSIIPAKGRGVVAGSAVRNVIELAGVKDVCAKLLSSSKNKLNIARGTIVALQTLSKTSKHARFTIRPMTKGSAK